MKRRDPHRAAAAVIITRTLLTFGLVSALLLTSSAMGDRVRNVNVGQEVPAFTVRTLSGDELKSADLRGQVVVLVYVAAAQKSSERALRAAGSVHRELRHADLSIVSMTADTVRVGDFRQQRSRLDFRHPLGLDVGRQVYGALGVIVLPTTLIIDREGQLAHVISSYKADHEHTLRTHVRHTLGLIDDKERDAQLKKKQYARDLPADRIARHRAAAELLREKGLLADAEAELRAALEIDSADIESQLDLAALLVVRDRVDEASALIDGVQAVEPGHRRGKLLHGIVLYHQDRLSEADRILQEALLLNPDPARTHYYLGLVKERRGDETAAIEHFKEALRRLLK